jgi:hypothetical protein
MGWHGFKSRFWMEGIKNTLGQVGTVHIASVRNRMGIQPLRSFFKGDLMDIHYALHNIVLPLTRYLVPIIGQHKRITSIYCI